MSCELPAKRWLGGRCRPASSAMLPANERTPMMRLRTALACTKDTLGAASAFPDLPREARAGRALRAGVFGDAAGKRAHAHDAVAHRIGLHEGHAGGCIGLPMLRSEERRVGEEC